MVVGAIVGRGGIALIGKASRGGIGHEGRVMGLVGQRDDPGHAGGSNARPADLEPALLALVPRRVVDCHARIRISIPGDIRCAPLAAAVIHVGCRAAVTDLVAGLRLIGAGSSASTAPDLLASVGAASAHAAATLGRPVDRQRGAANGEDVGRSRRIVGGRAAIARRDGDGDGLVEVAIIAGAGLAAKFRASPTVGDHLGVCRGITLGCQQIGEAVATCLDQQNMRLRGHGVCPFDIQADLQGPPTVGARIRCPTRLVDFREAVASSGNGGQGKLLGECIEIAGSRRVVVGINESDGDTSASVRAVEIVRVVHL